VANLLSNSVSVIDINPSSPTFNRVVDTIRVGLNPTDLAITGSGDRLFVANFGSSDLSVIDSHGGSESYHSVITNVGTGSGTRAVAVTADGGRVYVGTAQGYIVIDALDFGVISNTGTGTSTKTVAISADGTLAIVLTTQGVVLVFDITPGSARENQVIANGGSGTSTKSVAISADGGLGYLVTDQYIIVVSLNFGSAVAVIDQVVAPRTLEVVATITAGENPAYIAFDPTGSGTFVVTNSGDNSISVFDTSPRNPEATVMVTPETFSLKRKAKSMGALIEFAPGFSVHDIDLSTVYMHVGTNPDSIRASQTTFSFGDADLDGVEEMSTKFDALRFAQMVPLEDEVFVNVTGVVGTARFSGGSTVYITGRPSRGMSSLVGLEDFSGSGKGRTAVLQWVTSYEDGLAGFNVVRSTAVEGPYETVNAHLLPATGGESEAQYTCEDPGALLNRTYYYKLQAVANDALEELGPFPVVFRAAFALEQNAPNPFNPTTRIRFTLPEDGHANLTIYDVAGRRVRTLVDDKRRANHYDVVWDGRDHKGQTVASGVYFYRLVAGRHEKTLKMLLLK
jgi:WD40 repeat protein